MAVGVLRVSTHEQGDSHLGLDAQRAAIESFAASRGLTLLAVFEDVVSGTVAPADRAGMSAALALLRTGQAGVLLTAKVDRLSRKQVDLFALMDRAHREQWHIRTSDGVLDTGSSNGRLMASVAGLFAELERDLIVTRTRDAMAALKARGTRLGAPVRTQQAVRDQIRSLTLAGATQGDIAARLNEAGHATAQGCRWSQANVGRVIRSLRLDDLAEQSRSVSNA